MSVFQGFFFLFLGAGLLIIDFKSLSEGWLAFGSKGLTGRLEFHKDEHPVIFMVIFVLYLFAGLSLTVFALLLLAGMATPLPLR